jgi:hypothetical protein
MKNFLVATSAASILILSGFALLDGMKEVTITCKHCTKTYEIEIPEQGVGSMSYQHSPGCQKKTRVYWNNGKVTKTE